MTDALRYEWVRIRTLRSTYWLTGFAVLLGLLTGLGALGFRTHEMAVSDHADLLTGTDAGVLFQGVLMALVAIFAVGHEYRYGMIRGTLTAVPRRSVLLAAKLVVVIAWVLAATLLVFAVRYLETLVILGGKVSSFGFPSPLPRVLLGAFGYVLIFTLVGFALSSLFRSIPAAIVVVLVMPLVVENLIRALLSLNALKSISGMAKVLPFTAGAQAFSVVSPAGVRDGGPSGFQQLPSPGAGALTFFVFMAVLLAVGWVLFERRDA